MKKELISEKLQEEGVLLITNHQDFLDFLVEAYSENWKDTTEQDIKRAYMVYPDSFPCILEYEFDESELYPTYHYKIKYKKELQHLYSLLIKMFTGV